MLYFKRALSDWGRTTAGMMFHSTIYHPETGWQNRFQFHWQREHRTSSLAGRIAFVYA